MKRFLGIVVLVAAIGILPAAAQIRVIVRTSGGPQPLINACFKLNCQVGVNIDGSTNSLFLVTQAQTQQQPQTTVSAGGGGLLGLVGNVLNSVLSPVTQLLDGLLKQPGIVDGEPDIQIQLAQAPQGGPYPAGLYDTTPVSYYGATVSQGYVDQPATQIIGLPEAQNRYSVSGTGVIVAMIDTGVDPNQPVLQPELLQGYDFTRNKNGADETQDVPPQADPNADAEPGNVNQSTVGVLNQSMVGVLNGGGYSAFGHGTMTAGIVHLVAPAAQLLPLKAFGANGEGYLSDVLRAIYYAVDHRANVISMSFSFPESSAEMARALQLATDSGVINVASVGNGGSQTQVWPAAYPDVTGVASVNNSDQLSTFSNYGKMVQLAAPGEGIITTYPFATYAAGWGTSFSAPFVSGTAALILDRCWGCGQAFAAAALAHAQPGGRNLGHGVLNIPDALNALPW